MAAADRQSDRQTDVASSAIIQIYLKKMPNCLAADASLWTDRPLTLRERRSIRTYRK